ncbi:MAG TPA: hypothetical protein VF781_00420, partial [Solirubrobacteraceae bacterium]
NASIDGGACLSDSMPNPACQVGTGTVTATPFLLGLPGPSVGVRVTFDLVAPPAPGDLAGLAIVATNPVTGVPAQLGGPGDITVSAQGAVSIAFHNIPDTYPILGPAAVPIAVDEIQSTFDALRMPTRCPSPAARFAVSADSYADPTPKPASAPLNVSGCSSLPFSPQLSASAVKDSGDSGVAITTDVTQSAGEATSGTTGLSFPSAVLAPNAAAVISGGLLCGDPSFASCKTIGSSSATSPLYPRTLVGRVYLTGSLAAPAITVTFPPPFALTLNGSVNLATNTTTFTGVPDLPLADLQVSLAGGPQAAFATTCATPSGDAVGSFISQDGDLLASSNAPFTVAGCPPSTSTGTGGSVAGATAAPLGLPSLAAATISGLRRGRPAISLKLIAGRGAPRLSTVSIPLPRGLVYVRHRIHRRLVLVGVTARYAQIRSLALSRGRLMITLRRPAATALILLSPRALHETAGLRRHARRRRVRLLRLTLAVTTATGQRVTLTRAVRPRS